MSGLRESTRQPAVARRAVAACVALGMVAAGCGSDTPSSDTSSDDDHSEVTAELAAVVEEAMERTGAPGMEVAVRFGDGERWVEQFGVADIDSGAPVEPGMVWPLRSVTKSFVVDVLLELEDEGVLSLDDTLDQYVDGVESGDEITLLQLADMSSGLPEYANAKFVDAFLADPTRNFTNDELLAFIDGDELLSVPGSEHTYINTNSLLVGMVIEAATGQDLGEVLQERIFDLLDLESTLYAPVATEIVDSLPIGYQPGDGELVAAPATFGVFGGSGAIAATSEDVLDWGAVLASGELLADDGEQQRSDARPLDSGPEYDAYGLGIGELDGWWGHTGTGLGFTALVMHDAGSDTTVTIFTNISNLDDGEHLPTSLFRQFAPILDDDQ